MPVRANCKVNLEIMLEVWEIKAAENQTGLKDKSLNLKINFHNFVIIHKHHLYQESLKEYW
jgi:hypothetical protein